MHPNYIISEQNTSYDIAIIELDRPCTAAKPTSINTTPDELSSNVVGVGFGVSGIADQPETVAPYDKKIAGENVVDSIGGLVHLGNATLLYCDFEHPTLGGCNKMGSSTPRPLEYICSGGDSGGGLFRQKGRQWELVGICSGSNTDIDQLLKTGYYCQVMAWTRVSAFQDWIADNTK